METTTTTRPCRMKPSSPVRHNHGVAGCYFDAGHGGPHSYELSRSQIHRRLDTRDGGEKVKDGARTALAMAVMLPLIILALLFLARTGLV